MNPTGRATRAASLPRLLVIADAATAGGRLPTIVAKAVHYGTRAVVLRARALPAAALLELAAALRRLLAPVDGLLITAGGPGVAGGPAGARGPGTAVHLAARDAFPEPRPMLVGRSCHNAAEVSRAAVEGCDYVTVSPVYRSRSKPGYGPMLGPSGLAALCQPNLPVFALGGIMPDSVPECLAAGAYGVAAMGPILRTPVIVTEYLGRLPRCTEA